MEEIYSEKYWNLFENLDESLAPRGPDQLYDIATPYVGKGARILDLGCRDARHLVRLLELSDGTGVGVDPVAWHIERAQRVVADANLGTSIELSKGTAKAIPSDDAAFDVVWCRDILEVLPDLELAMHEVARVLKGDGHVIIYTNVLSGEIDQDENVRIHEPLGNVATNLEVNNLENVFAQTGFSVVLKHVVGTEWREFLEEQEPVVSRDLLRLARLRRRHEEFAEEFGNDAYRTAEASLQWAVNQFIGRFVPVVYVLGRQ